MASWAAAPTRDETRRDETPKMPSPSDLCCETCDSSFQRREHYERHLRTHTKEKPFTCSECGQSFGRVDSLARHYTTIHLSADRQHGSERCGERRRVAQACKPCSVSKVRCDGERPCQRCRRTGHGCVYEPSVKRNPSVSSSHHTPPAKRTKSSNAPPPSPPAAVNDHGSRDQTPAEAEAILARLSPPDSRASGAASVDQPPEPEPPVAHLPTNCHDHSDMSLDAGFDPDLLDPRLSISTPSMFLGDPAEGDAWLNDTFDTSFMSSLFMQDAAGFNSLDNFWLEPLDDLTTPQSAFTPPTSQSSSGILDQSAVAELYSRSHSPAVDLDNVEPRQYHPTCIEIDAQLAFPDFSHLGSEDVDDENLAHVEEISAESVYEISRRANKMQIGPNFPQFVDVNIPPRPVLNAWVQLYFEAFHPVFPILHKSSFTSCRTHWLLMFAVAAIGAHFSSIPNAQSCSRVMHELIRRQTSIMCEEQNKNSRELWMSQTLVLNHIGMVYSGDRRHLEIAEVLQSVPVAVGRRKRLFTNMFPVQKFSKLQLPLGQKWQVWLLDEARRRAGFGIWLLDSAFQRHFDVTRLMTVAELQMPLPCADDRWGASSAQCWASFPAPQGSVDPVTIGRVIADNTWKTTWAKSSTIGRQVILQHLSDVITNRGNEHPGVPCFSDNDRLQAVDNLTNLLALIENEQLEQPLDQVKSATVERITAMEALMMYNCPIKSLSPTMLNFIYDKLDGGAWAKMAEQWNSAAAQGRMACFLAARILHVVRSTRCVHFGTPVALLRATGVLWTYSMLAERFPDLFLNPSAAGAVILGPKALDAMESADWIEAGWSRVKLPGVGNLLSAQGRCKVLDESTVLMRSLKAWGISSTYAHIIARLRANETCSS